MDGGVLTWPRDWAYFAYGTWCYGWSSLPLTAQRSSAGLRNFKLCGQVHILQKQVMSVNDRAEERRLRSSRIADELKKRVSIINLPAAHSLRRL